MRELSGTLDSGPLHCGLDTRLEGDLRLASEGGRLAMRGAVRTAEGTYKAYRQTWPSSAG